MNESLLSFRSAYLGLGSNLGDRLGQMQAALDQLHCKALRIREISPVYENRAIGMDADAGPFLNAVVRIETSLEAHDLLDRCLEVEEQLGRIRSGKWTSRTIDLDIIVWGEAEILSQRLEVPHPRMAERDFVVHPLNAIAPDLLIRGQRISELARNLPINTLTLYAGRLRRPSPDMKPSVEIEYCSGCRWLPRSAWIAQELLTSFESELGAVTLKPSNKAGTFQMRVEGVLLWDRREEGRFPEIKELKQRLRDQIAPGRPLGHSDTS